jgi:LuxR family maltose regulon positive regulatory protein
MPFILETKINIPRLPDQTTARNRLIKKLDEGLNKKLTILSAPAGFGKSTLLCQWLENKHANAAWLSIDEADNDINRFIAYIIKSIQKLSTEIGGTSLSIIQSQPNQPSIERMLGHLINDIVKHKRQIILVLDDYHLIQLKDIHSALTFLLDHMPNNLHLCILTRSDPPILLSRLRGQNQVEDIRSGDLSFNFAESFDFFKKALPLTLSEKQVKRLNARTEGWAAGLQMAAISMQGKSDVSQFINDFSNSNRFVLDFLIEEVFHNQSEDVQQYLIQTSILTRLNNALCHAVTQNKYEHISLDQLFKSDLFIIRLDNTENWYRYHHLFADLLYKLLVQHTPNQMKALHERACQWYQEQHLITDAINHALKAEDFSKAEYLLSQIAEGLWRQGQQGVILGWLKQFPEGYETSNPRLCAVSALMVFLDGRYDEAEDYIHLAEKNISNLDDAQFKGVIAAIRSYIADYRGRIEEALKYGHMALSSLTDEYAIWRSLAAMALGDVYVQKGPLIPATESYKEARRCGTIAGSNYCNSLAQHRFVAMYHRRGQLTKAIKLAEQFISDENQIANPSGALYLIQAELLYEFNRLDEAENSIRTAIHLCEEQHHAAALPYCHMQLARILLARADHFDADNETQKSIKLLRQLNVPQWVESFVVGWQILYCLKKGDIHQSESILSERDLPIPCKFNYPNETEYLCHARWLASQNKIDPAIDILQQLDQWLVSIDWLTLALEVKLVWANVLFSQGYKKEALNKLNPAFRLADTEGYCRSFLDEFEPMQSLLQEAKKQNIYPEICFSLLRNIDRKEQPTTYTDSIDSLSRRELQVLKLLNTQMTSAEIAGEIFVSVNTIKTHIKNIYSKLNVHNRREAVQKATEMHII